MRNYVTALKLTSVFFLLGFLLISCGDRNQPDDATMNRNRENYRNKIETAKDEIDKFISDLQAESDTVNDAGKKDINRQIEILRERRNELNGKLDELGKTTKEKWEDFKEGADKLMSKLDEDFRDVRNRTLEEKK